MHLVLSKIIALMLLLQPTKYQGGESKIVEWVDYCTKNLKLDSVIDAFSRIGCCGGYVFKNHKNKFLITIHIM
jgi:hypothetical protein